MKTVSYHRTIIIRTQQHRISNVSSHIYIINMLHIYFRNCADDLWCLWRHIESNNNEHKRIHFPGSLALPLALSLLFPIYIHIIRVYKAFLRYVRNFHVREAAFVLGKRALWRAYTEFSKLYTRGFWLKMLSCEYNDQPILFNQMLPHFIAMRPQRKCTCAIYLFDLFELNVYVYIFWHNLIAIYGTHI